MKTFFCHIRIFFAFVILTLLSGVCLTAQMSGNGAIWKKVEISQSGIYRITKEELKSMGFSSADDVSVVGNGGQIISEYIDDSKDYHLEIQPSMVTAGGDLIFFSTGLVNWFYDKNNRFYTHVTNHYANNAYVMVTNAIRPQRFEKESHAKMSDDNLSYYISTALHESDLISLSESGRHLFGEDLSLNLSLSLSNLQKSKSAKFSVAWTALAKYQSVTLKVHDNNTTYISSTITKNQYENQAALDTYKLYGLYQKDYSGDFINLPSGGNSINLNFSLSNKENPSVYLDFLEVNYRNDAHFADNGQYMVRYPATLTSPKSLHCNGLGDKIVIKVNQLTGKKKIVNATEYLNFDSNDVFFAVSDINGAFRIGKVQDVSIKENILSLESVPDMVIITTDELAGQAERLASFHRLNDAADVLVVTQSDVFNLFNSGTRDASCYRLLMNYFYRKNIASSSDKNMSLLLFGDGLYDNRKISRDVKGDLFDKKEFLLTYQSENSLDIDSYTSDDFFCVMKNRVQNYTAMDNYRPLDLENQKLDISVGRIPSRTVEEASNVVDKIINYYKNNFGIWKTATAFVADNGDSNSHTKQSASISDILENLQPSINCEKIYLADYKRVSVGGKITVPQAKQKMMEALKRGLLLINYNGHGSPSSWADEQLLTTADIKTFNYTKLPLWITATCDFGNYDSHNTSAAEQILLLPNSGGIGLLSTSRVVWDIPNTMLNKAVIKELFSNTDDRNRTLGEVIKDAKNSLLNQIFPKNRLNFSLLGDPMLKIYIPSNDIKITELNGEDVVKNTASINVNALQKINIKANITAKGKLDEDFSGKVIVTIYDSKKEKQTIDNFSRKSNNTQPFIYEDYSNIIFSSVVKAEKGKIDFDFIVPKDVSYTNKNCRIHLYAFDEKNKKHCIGSNYNMVISPSEGGGVVDGDTTSVVIRDIKLGGVPFTSGIVVGNSPTFFADIIDNSSVNLSNSGLGHSMVLSIDNKKETTYLLSGYYNPSSDEYGAGTITFPLPEISEGEHTATFSVWDVAGNVTKKTISFSVRNNIEAEVEQLDVFPNPVYLSKNGLLNVNLKYKLLGKNVDLSASIYTLNGELICSSLMEKQNYDPSSNSIHATWNINKYSIPSGLYLFNLQMKENGHIKSNDSRVIVINNEK